MSTNNTPKKKNYVNKREKLASIPKSTCNKESNLAHPEVPK
jgi:hypothetical protein